MFRFATAHPIAPLAALLFTCLWPLSADAIPISISSGETASFNFDLTGAVPSPDYLTMSINFGLGGIDDGEGLNYTIFSDLNLGGGVADQWGTIFSLPPGYSANLGTSISGLSVLNDGIFSMSVTAIFGDFSLNPYAIGLDALTRTQPVYATVVTTSVPEPSTLALLSIGLAGIGLMRRRRPLQFA